MTGWRRRGLTVAVVGASACLLWWGTANLSTTTRQGVNFQVFSRRVPLHVKAIAFLHRHYEYRLLAQEITRGLRSDHERVLALFRWTRQRIRPTPKDWPVIDDHVLDIIIRGHGLPDQMADVFTTLATYARLPAFWTPGLVSVSFVRVDGRWAMFDVANGLVFADAQGRLIDVGTLLADRSLVDGIAGSLTPGGHDYAWHVDRLKPFRVPAVLRARMHMPLPRLVAEGRRVLGLLPRTPQR